VLRVRRVIRPALVALAVVALAALGTWVGLRVAGTKERATPIGNVAVRVAPSWGGGVDGYVPLADWGLRARAFTAPVTLHAEARTIDRQGAIKAAGGDTETLRATEAALESAAESSLQRAWRYALGGALAAGLIGVLGVLALRRRSRALLLTVALAPVALVGLAGGGTLLAVQRTFDATAFERPTFYARGRELVQLLDAAEGAARAGNSYVDKVQAAVRGFASLLADTGMEAGTGINAVVASDLHNNAFALDSLADLLGEETVFMVGDFGHEGSETEARLVVSRLKRFGDRVVAVSGNHDSTALMERLAQTGATVLTTDGQLRADGTPNPDRKVIDVEGLRVAGYSDPLEWAGERPDDPRRIFGFGQLPDEEAAREDAKNRLVAWFDTLPETPDVVMVHQNSLAQHLAASLRERGHRTPLTVLTGHDHQQHVDGYGPITVVDGGTVGAGGVFGIGSQAVGLGRLHFGTAGQLRSVDLVEVEPVSGATQAERVIIDPDSCPAPAGEPPDVCRLDRGD
jgi:hypothetical protein